MPFQLGRRSKVIGTLFVLGIWVAYWERFVAPNTDLVRTSWLTKDVGSGSVFVLRQGTACGAFQIVEQGFLESAGQKREEVVYSWRYRDDGGSALTLSPAVQSGHERGPHILFGPFRLLWSAAAFGRGYLYYGRKHDEAIRLEDTRVAVTSLDTLDGASCSDARWTFRAASNDPGEKAHP